MTVTQHSEDEARRLLALATEDVPPGLDLLAGFQSRRGSGRPRPRRILIAAGTVAAAAMTAIAVTLTLTAGPAPAPAPAGRAGPADLARAAMITAAQNYRVTSHIAQVQPTPGFAQTITGAFDPARGIGAETIDGLDLARYDGRYLYLRILPSGRKAYQQIYAQQYHLTLRPSQIWERITEPKLASTRYLLIAALPQGSVTSVQVLRPSGLVALLQGARQVRATGRVSGPGWQGTAYSFQLRASMAVAHSKLVGVVTFSGVADVDQQNRIRSLSGLATSRTLHAPNDAGTTVSSVSLSFSSFGQPIPVSIPPGRQVIIRPHN
jgi:hypothetical protein